MQASAFLRSFAFMSGFEDVEKPEPERRPNAGQRSVSARSGLELKVFQLPQERCKWIERLSPYNYLILPWKIFCIKSIITENILLKSIEYHFTGKSNISSLIENILQNIYYNGSYFAFLYSKPVSWKKTPQYTYRKSFMVLPMP